MSLTPPQRHALRVVCEMSRRGEAVAHVRRDSIVPVRSLEARGLVAWTPRGLEPTEEGWAIAARMRPPIPQPS